MVLRIGVSTGLYMVARAEELATAVKKIGYALTRGVGMIELAGDVPHEVSLTQGREIRYIAKKQGLTLGFHGSLTVPVGLPERSDWRDADVHLRNSVRSAVFCGSKYVNFHSCINYWLELLTFAGRKLTSAFVDHEGRFISEILKECKPLREWFVKEKWDNYFKQVFTEEELSNISNESSYYRRGVEDQIRSLEAQLRAAREAFRAGQITEEQVRKAENALEQLEMRAPQITTEHQESAIRALLSEKLERGGSWRVEELRPEFGTIDGYTIMGHYMFFQNDPIWKAMLEQYPNVSKNYKLVNGDPTLLEKAWREAERNNDRDFKEFFYGAICAKYLEGHLKRLFEWMKKELPKELKGKDEAETKELEKNAKEINITIESPDARDPSHAGLFLLWHPKAVYAAVKTIRKTLKTDKVWMLIDFEHIATQGVDAHGTLKDVTDRCNDFGKLTFACHSNRPNPLHAHYPVEIGDVELYELQYMLKMSGMGDDREAYIIFERGGGEDPFKQAVDALKLMVDCLEKNIPPEKLPMEFFGLKGHTAGSFTRQLQIIQEHKHDVIKDLLEMPEEDWTALSQTIIKRGKRPEVWKKAQYR
ncbi:MAG: hypothetical protein ABIH90_02725 [Candidatus Aenigmatarchaeota archaeon]